MGVADRREKQFISPPSYQLRQFSDHHVKMNDSGSIYSSAASDRWSATLTVREEEAGDGLLAATARGFMGVKTITVHTGLSVGFPTKATNLCPIQN